MTAKATNSVSTARTSLNQPPAIETQRAQRVSKLLDEWLADESGYDEATWPRLKENLEHDGLTLGSAPD